MAHLSRAAIAAAIVATLAAGCGGGGGGTDDGTAACQGASYVGGDATADADGDGLTNGAECALGTSPSVADTDGDGLADGAEVAAGTSPVDADTDDDGLLDGAEVAAGSSPLLADTDGDGLLDAAEVAAGTNPSVADTDGDGLLDGAEAGHLADPLAADTDGDGLLDGDEVALGLDPAVADPPTPAVCNVLMACARDALVPVKWQDRFNGDYRLALPTDAVVGELTFLDAAPPGRLAATGFDLAAQKVAGFVLSMDELVTDGDPTAQLNALAARISAAAGQAGVPWTQAELVAGRAVQSWDGFPAVVGARVNLPSASDAGTVRQAVLGKMAGLVDGTFAGLPAGAFGAGPFVLSLEVLSRRSAQGDAHRVVVVAAVAPKGWFDDKTQATRIVASDLTGGTALGQSGDGEGTRCDAMPVEGDPRADFVWMSDISGSTDDERDPIRLNAAAVFGRLDTLGIDFRMGVVQHTSNRVTRPTEGQHGQLLGSGFTRDQATFAGWWSLAGGDGSEYGLTAVDDVVGPGGTGVPRSATEQATKVRDGVKLVVVYVSDEHPQEIEAACSSVAKDACNNPSDADYPCRDLTGNACVAGVIQPFQDHLAAEEAIAFGIIAPPPGGCPTSYEVGFGYAELIGALGGSYGSVCASDPGQTLDDIVSAVAGAASSFQLAGRPIAMTLKVVVTAASAPVCDPANPGPGRREVQRSQVDGFDYDPVNDTIFFVGASRPAAGDTLTVSYREWEDQTADPNPDPPACTGCGTCDVGYVCELSLCACIPRPG